MTASEKISDFKEVTAAEKTTIENKDKGWEKPSEEFIDQWNTACKSVKIHGKYNENTGYFELNGLTDISYEQALDINRQSEIYSDSDVCGGYTSRTLYPIRSSKSGWIAVSFIAKFENSTLEVINFSLNPQLRTSAVAMFANCRKLRVIKGIMTLATSNPNDVINMFSVCPELRELQLKSLKISISFSDSPLLSLDSISYMVTNAANTSPITITLHPDAYARLTDEIITAATARQITFATPT